MIDGVSYLALICRPVGACVFASDNAYSVYRHFGANVFVKLRAQFRTTQKSQTAAQSNLRFSLERFIVFYIYSFVCTLKQKKIIHKVLVQRYKLKYH